MAAWGRVIIRPATDPDWPALWAILKPVFRAGDTYAVDRDIPEAAAKAMWMDAPDATYLAEDGDILGTYFIKTNHKGAASHVCNCGYVTSAAARGRGLATEMCQASQTQARALGFKAMQFNMVVASNVGAVALWHRLGFDTVGTLPLAFEHPTLGMIDAFVMWKAL